MNAHERLAVVCDVIARLQGCSISDANCHFQDLVVQRIEETGKDVDELTVGQVRAIVQAATEDFNREWNARRRA